MFPISLPRFDSIRFFNGHLFCNFFKFDVLVATSSLPFLILVILCFPFFLVSLGKILWICWFFLKKIQFSVLFIVSIVFLFHFSFISAIIFIISFLLLPLNIAGSYLSSVLHWKVRLSIRHLSSSFFFLNTDITAINSSKYCLICIL